VCGWVGVCRRVCFVCVCVYHIFGILGEKPKEIEQRGGVERGGSGEKDKYVHIYV